MAFTWKKYNLSVLGNGVGFMYKKVRFQLAKQETLRWWRQAVLSHPGSTLKEKYECWCVCMCVSVCVNVLWECVPVCVFESESSNSHKPWWAQNTAAEQTLWKSLSQVCTLRKCQAMNFSHRGQNLPAFQNNTDLLKPSTGFQQGAGTAFGQGILIFLVTPVTWQLHGRECCSVGLITFPFSFPPMKQGPQGLSEHPWSSCSWHTRRVHVKRDAEEERQPFSQQDNGHLQSFNLNIN